MKDNWVVTVSRQYGSGGRYIAKMLAQQLGVPIYDKQIIAMTAQNFGFSKDFVATYEERPINRFYYAFSLGGTDFHSGLSIEYYQGNRRQRTVYFGGQMRGLRFTRSSRFG